MVRTPDLERRRQLLDALIEEFATGGIGGRSLREVSLGAYRDGRDSVAFHGDRIGRRSGNTVVALVSLGSPRRFLLRPTGVCASALTLVPCRAPEELRRFE